jgi:hypothetical protein
METHMSVAEKMKKNKNRSKEEGQIYHYCQDHTSCLTLRWGCTLHPYKGQLGHTVIGSRTQGKE